METTQVYTQVDDGEARAAGKDVTTDAEVIALQKLPDHTTCSALIAPSRWAAALAGDTFLLLFVHVYFCS